MSNQLRPSRAARPLFHEARRALGIDQLILVVHDSMYPSLPGEDPGRGSPYSGGARALVELARDLGFTGVQSGPQGETSAVNKSPYDGTVFARSVLSVDFVSLARDPAWSAIVERSPVEDTLARAGAPDGRVHYEYVFHEQRRLVARAYARFCQSAPPALRDRFARFRARSAWWLVHDQEYEARAHTHGTEDRTSWPDAEPSEAGRAHAERFAFGQFLVDEQHQAARRDLCGPEWKTFGDLQVGLSSRDRWRREGMFLDGYALGAPPSRTDPSGQAWGFPVFHPDSRDADRFLRARADKMFAEFDGVRIDHPHGLVTPWVYDARAADPLAAVAAGARLLDSPDLPDHPRLAAFAIARAEQIDRGVSRHADERVRWLDGAQVEAYARRIGVLLDAARDAGRDRRDVVTEVLSTQPYPLRRVMERLGLGRFLVTQKAALHDPRDGYRSANAAPEDWIMFGNHDTAPMALVLDRWRDSGQWAARARYYAERLAPGDEPNALAREMIADRRALARAACADLFVSRARHVTIFASDLFGLRGVYNRPGVVDDVNWTLRIPNDFHAAYAAGVARGDGMDLAAALALALRAKSEATRARTDLIDALEAGG